MNPSPGGAGGRNELTLLFPLRLLASVAIVWHHMRESYFLGLGFGLPLFLVILFGLTASSTRRESLARFARRRLSYLLTPWLRWSLVYLALLALADLTRGTPPAARLEWNMLLYGGHPSLWFLPYAALASLPVKLLQRVSARFGVHGSVLVAAGIGLAASFALVHISFRGRYPAPLSAWLLMLPAIPYGLALAGACRLPRTAARGRLLFCVALVAAAGALLPTPTGPDSELLTRFASAVPLACLGFAWSPPIPFTLRALASLNFGVYLIHPLVGKTLVEVVDVERLPGYLHLIVAWVGAAVVLLLLRKLRPGWQECRRPVRPRAA